MYICICAGVTDDEVHAEITEGVTSEVDPG